MIDLFSQLLVSVPTGLGSAWLASFQFQSQRRWDKKEESYREVLEALHEMSRSNNTWYDAELEHRELSTETSETLRKSWRIAQGVIYKYADTGSVTLSPEAEKILVKLRTELDRRFNSFFEELDSHAPLLKTAMIEMKRTILADRQKFVWWKLTPPKWFRAD